ncbi:hypothetical protein BH20GEM2_BH20GEM2_15830 [soil metagenome]
MNRIQILPRGGFVATVVAAGTLVAPAAAQWSTGYEQTYLPAGHNWEFRDNYAGADRLFNAFDYGHAILYEVLYTKPNAPASVLEEDRFDFLTRKLLVNPPRVPLEEGAIEVAYAKLVPEAKLMFDWAHLLHRQIYDVWADESLSPPEKDAEIAEIVRYYKSRPDLAFSSVPKSMDAMDGHFYSLAFREKYPKFNGLIWAYHWLQVGLYEPLMVGSDLPERKALVDATVGRFWQMVSDAPENMPYLMPMTAGVAPEFAKRYPEAGAIFDNLHMMHDVVSDILVSPEVPRARKRAEILAAAAMFRDDTTYAISREEWLGMGEMMGLENMGGRAVGFLAALPQPTVPRGMSMAGMQHGGMRGMEGMQHGGMEMGGEQPRGKGMDHGATEQAEHGTAMHELHTRMMRDAVIRERIMADPELRRLMQRMMEEMSEAEHQETGKPAESPRHDHSQQN